VLFYIDMEIGTANFTTVSYVSMV